MLDIALILGCSFILGAVIIQVGKWITRADISAEIKLAHEVFYRSVLNSLPIADYIPGDKELRKTSWFLLMFSSKQGARMGYSLLLYRSGNEVFIANDNREGCLMWEF